MEVKTCTKCNEPKPLDQYHRNKRAKDGRHSRCAECCRQYQSELRDNPEVKAQRREYAKVWRAANPNYDRERYLKQSDLQIARALKWNRDNPEKALASRKAYLANNPEKRRALRRTATARRRAKLAQLHDTMPKDYLKILLGFYGEQCQKCGGVEKLEHDHIIPVTWKGSTHSLYNAQVLCRSCNSRKGNRHAKDYRCWSNGILCERVVT